MALKFIDFLCGAGGFSTGLVESGMELLLGVNHWDVALRTHAANHPRADHALSDVADLRMRYLPKADGLVASPICTELSPAGGNVIEQPDNQLDLFDEDENGFKELPKEAFEKTRVTAWCTVRAVEARPGSFKFVVIENVPDFVTRWPLFRAYVSAMADLGLQQHQVISLNSAHIGDDTNLSAPQWRDRVYVIFTPRAPASPT
ncbi:DNA cytosine methyltransferase [Kitasatospora acidiphila]|uniref:DNA cytosine methyltransferase n=1 Tax=Kitasatospora acidiphila TaxID=2567942 RepID=UPI001E2FAEE0|nr:DNA cytosine methyltransferase [Kitasatospora acidiphila]